MEDDPAPDVTDLATAKRLIAELRAEVERLVEEAETLEGEHVVFLSPEQVDKAEWLYKARKLIPDQDAEIEYEEAFEMFVEGAIDIFFDMAVMEQEKPPDFPYRPPTA